MKKREEALILSSILRSHPTHYPTSPSTSIHSWTHFFAFSRTSVVSFSFPINRPWMSPPNFVAAVIADLLAGLITPFLCSKKSKVLAKSILEVVKLLDATRLRLEGNVFRMEEELRSDDNMTTMVVGEGREGKMELLL